MIPVDTPFAAQESESVQAPGEPGGVPDAVAPPPRHPRFPLIDGMRAIAALTVVGLHTAVAGQAVSASIPGRLLAHLNIGVTIFFLISGFLLYRPFIAHRAGGPAAPRARDYAKRRILRIYPAYWVVLTVLVLVPGLTGVSGGHWFGM
jgi:peptidoglycan/LPS O-acetylase OafA/YrhL